MSRPLPSNRPLGSTGLLVSPLCIGCAPLGDMPETFTYSTPEETALATIREALASPINFIDTAAAYGDGESERRLGKAIRENGGLPSGFVLATKADRCLKTGDFSGEQIKPRITSTVVGVSKPERISQTLELASRPIPSELWAEVDKIEYDLNDPEANRFV